MGRIGLDGPPGICLSRRQVVHHGVHPGPVGICVDVFRVQCDGLGEVVDGQPGRVEPVVRKERQAFFHPFLGGQPACILPKAAFEALPVLAGGIGCQPGIFLAQPGEFGQQFPVLRFGGLEAGQMVPIGQLPPDAGLEGGGIHPHNHHHVNADGVALDKGRLPFHLRLQHSAGQGHHLVPFQAGVPHDGDRFQVGARLFQGLALGPGQRPGAGVVAGLVIPHHLAHFLADGHLLRPKRFHDE